MTRHVRKLDLTLSLTTWSNIDTAPRERVDGQVRTILLRGRYESGRETLPYPCWWNDVAQRWSGWPYAAVEPTHWMEMVPLPPMAMLIAESDVETAEDVFADAGAFFADLPVPTTTQKEERL